MPHATDSGVIKIDYYPGAYGPTIRIDIPSAEGLSLFRDQFSRMTRDRLAVIDICALEGVECTGLQKLFLKQDPGQHEPFSTLRLLRTRSKDILEFEWKRTSEGWLECKELLDGLEIGGPGGHQYFTFESVDDALIEIAYMER